MKDTKTVYYDSFDDDFAGTNIKTAHIDESYPFIRKNPLWRLGSFVVYRVIAYPLVNLYDLVVLGVRYEGLREVRRLKQPFFIYANHTQTLDCFIPHAVSFPRRCYTVAGPDAVSIKGLENIVSMLGAIPLPETVHGLGKFASALETRVAHGGCVAIFPEAHIWPYYTGIRPFSSASFRYPVVSDSPAVAMVTTYRKRRFLSRPAMTVTLSPAFYPDAALGRRAASEKLRDEVYGYMKKVSGEKENYEYIKYIKRDTADNNIRHTEDY